MATIIVFEMLTMFSSCLANIVKCKDFFNWIKGKCYPYHKDNKIENHTENNFNNCNIYPTTNIVYNNYQMVINLPQSNNMRLGVMGTSSVCLPLLD